ncbi:sodium-dependent phosphate transport protein 2B-like [Glandiceps talaboti]
MPLMPESADPDNDNNNSQTRTDEEHNPFINDQREGTKKKRRREDTRKKRRKKDTNDQQNIPPWSELTSIGKIKRFLVWLGKALLVILCLYLFITALASMGAGFTMIGGSAAGAALSDSSILRNPVSGLMVGMLVTVLLQSSSATTSIIVTMVAADILQVKETIPMVMGANIGTSITNTIVAGGQANNRDMFRLSFAGATVHDCFNWLAVIVLLPVEVATGMLYRLTSAIINSFHIDHIESMKKFKISDPIVKRIIRLDLAVIEMKAVGVSDSEEESLVDRWCVTDDVNYNDTVYMNSTLYNYTTVHNYTIFVKRCDFLFAHVDWSDEAIGIILLAVSLVLLMGCLFVIVKLLKSIVRGSATNATKKFLNAKFPGKLAWLSGYVAMLIGCFFTILLQSSSVFTSIVTPIVGMGLISLERMYPLTLGANIGTTFTSIMAAFASSNSTDFEEGVQISLCHLFFNLFGIVLWYPIPKMRKLPIKAATFLGNTTAGYRWFSIAYILIIFFLIPSIFLALSLLGWQYVVVAVVIVVIIVGSIITLNIFQTKCAGNLPKKLQTWDFLPKYLRSLEPYDNIISRCTRKCKCRRHRNSQETIEDQDFPLQEINTSTSH